MLVGIPRIGWALVYGGKPFPVKQLQDFTGEGRGVLPRPYSAGYQGRMTAVRRWRLVTPIDWTDNQVRRAERGANPAELAPILKRLGIGGETWVDLGSRLGSRFWRPTVTRPAHATGRTC